MKQASDNQILQNLFNLHCVKRLYEKQCWESFRTVVRWVDRKKDEVTGSERSTRVRPAGMPNLIKRKETRNVEPVKRTAYNSEEHGDLRTRGDHELRIEMLEGEEHNGERAKEKIANPLEGADPQKAMHQGCWEPAKVDKEGYRIPPTKKRKADDIEAELVSQLLEARNWEANRSENTVDEVRAAVEPEIGDVWKE